MDTGLFVSGGMDGVVKVWDTNTLGVVLEFDFKDKVPMREKNTNAIFWVLWRAASHVLFVAWMCLPGAICGVPHFDEPLVTMK